MRYQKTFNKDSEKLEQISELLYEIKEHIIGGFELREIEPLIDQCCEIAGVPVVGI